MRLILISALAIAAALTAGLQSAGAVHNARYCLRSACSFNTWQQCTASARGVGGHCRENPRWRGRR
jgi:hypothetical protein